METKPKQSNLLTAFLQTLLTDKKINFQGDIENSYGARIVASTDNSVYQVLPKAILYPRVADDINTIVSLLATEKYISSDLSIVARGGGTGTNGQSLNESLILDTSRYLNNIIALDAKAMQVVVEPGVVLDQLNAYLAVHGLFFPPDVSSSSRATLGGMVATDASGKGSRIYGKTSNYIKSLDVVLSDGSDLCVKTSSFDAIKKTNNPLAKQAQETVYALISDNQDEIKAIFPKMNRGLTGYNLEHVIQQDQFSLAYLLAGSEGTLALSKQITLKVIVKPKVRALVVVLYNDFDRTLEHIPHLLKADPVAIEVLDDKILHIAQQDPIWQDVQSSFNNIDLSDGIKGLNFIEVTGNTASEVEQQCQALESIISNHSAENSPENNAKNSIIATLIEKDPKIINSLWGIRKRAVGLLGALKGERQPTAFVEDTAVPPENLPAFIKDFRSILDSHGLAYGMYGHADVGCLHVRPALDMRQQADQKLIRVISDQIVALTQKYGGLLWGEHGRGFRGEYSPLFFGEQLYPVLREIKAAFDPHNLFNPGKLATPSGSDSGVTAIDKVSFRGSFDAQINQEYTKKYPSALRCNGNGACFSWDKNEAMCPSYKATRDKRYSPKGRATMLREWLRLESIANKNIIDNVINNVTNNITKSETSKKNALEAELYESLNACLSCKSCTHSCPIKVDIPELKSQFLQHYYKKHKRPIADHAFALFDAFASIGRTTPRIFNTLFQNKLSRTILEKTTGIINTPRFSNSLKKGLQQRQAEFVSKQNIDQIGIHRTNNEKAVILLPDSFNGSYKSEVLLAAYDVITLLGFKAYIAPILTNGKALHVKGFRKKFKTVAEQHVHQMQALAKAGLPMISVEIVSRLMHTKEYPDVLEQQPSYSVISIETWLLEQLGQLEKKQIAPLATHSTEKSYTLLPHCMEQTADKKSFAHWQKIFEALNISLQIKISGCCGMSGLFGHEKDNKILADKIYANNWHETVKQTPDLLATGFSCACQLENHDQRVKHPIEIIRNVLTKV